MATAELPGIVAVSRAVVSAAAELVAGVERAMVGDGKVRTAQGNAWDALQADRARARARAEMDELVAALLADSPRRRRTTPADLVPTATPRPH
jgi:hypothetical protein